MPCNRVTLPGGGSAIVCTTTKRYARGGTDDKSAMLVRVHPDVSRVVQKFGRTHHHVNYERFLGVKLRRRADFDPSTITPAKFKLIPTGS